MQVRMWALGLSSSESNSKEKALPVLGALFYLCAGCSSGDWKIAPLCRNGVDMRARKFAALSFAIIAYAIIARESRAAASDAFSINATPLLSIQAPADVYFGTYRLSNLSVRNAIHDMNIEGDSPLALPGQIERINAVQSALADWALRYPRDPWLPSTMARFATFLIGKHIPQYDRVALSFLEELTTLYPNTQYARLASTNLQDFEVLPEFNLRDGPDVRSMPLIFESVWVGIGANRRYHVF